MATLFIIFSVRLVGTLICFCSGPWWCLCADPGAGHPVRGVIFGHLFHAFPDLGIEPGAFAIAGMGAFRRHRACPHYRHRAGDRDDRQLSANPAHDDHHHRGNPGGAMVGGALSIPRSWSELYGLLRVKTGGETAESRPVNSLFIRINPAWSRIVKGNSCVACRQ